MANPNTRESLKQYCLRALGKPVIRIKEHFLFAFFNLF